MGLRLITDLNLCHVCMYMYSIDDFATRSTCDNISFVIKDRQFYLLYSYSPDQYNHTEYTFKKQLKCCTMTRESSAANKYGVKLYSYLHSIVTSMSLVAFEIFYLWLNVCFNGKLYNYH